ncbi:MAG: thymidylate synthase, partial [Chloroflexi bacterium]|nr:thymidylate synthase [Chloroflexota bacterium]
TDPAARLSRTESRGKPFSCLGELCWYLSKSNDVDFISYYIRDYREDEEDGVLFGAYGPRLFNWRGLDQVNTVTDILRGKRDSRQAVIQLFEPNDITAPHKDVPCTCTLQFMNRQGRLDLITYMRSNDAFLGLPHDVFSFTMLQEIVARSLSVDLGTYKHIVGSFHLYDRHVPKAEEFLGEGWQSTDSAMPLMPLGDPWPAISSLLELEPLIRAGDSIDDSALLSVDPYWADLVRLLQIFRASQDGARDRMIELNRSMSSDAFAPFVASRIS